MSRIRVLVADDHTIVRQGLVSLLQAEQEIEVIGQAADGLEAVAQAAALRPDIVVLDITMPRLSGLDAARRIREAQPQCRILVLTMHDDEEYVLKMTRVGASGYIVKDGAAAELIEAIRSLAAGRTYFAGRVPRLPGAALGTNAHATNNVHPLASLTNREREVFQLVAEAKTNPQIAKLLGLSPKTVDNHRTRLMEKLGIHSTAELVRFAARHGLLE
ncbi:MAG: response regulator [Luteitalea sp.]|nr:response regulator [Luteitalea sp.]